MHMMESASLELSLIPTEDLALGCVQYAHILQAYRLCVLNCFSIDYMGFVFPVRQKCLVILLMCYS